MPPENVTAQGVDTNEINVQWRMANDSKQVTQLIPTSCFIQ